jgi:hypothetical protein
MPVIYVCSPTPAPPDGLLERLFNASATTLGLPHEHVWALWQYGPLGNAFRPDWVEPRSAPPIVTVSCKSRYTKPQIAALLHTAG